jgi:UDP-N-acetylglucosamine 2-epimerase (non-hydrolysing)
MADTMLKTEALLEKLRPDAVVILGDTNSAMAAIPSERMGVPVYHLEAGNRSFDANVPEELNRRLVDHIATFNLPYTEHARRNLLSEGIPTRRVFLSGSPLAEVFEHYRGDIEKSAVLDSMRLGLEDFFLASIHRQENVDHPSRLREVFSALQHLSETHGVPVIVSTHPRTRNRIRDLDTSRFSGLIFAEPFGYFDFMKLQLSARCVISDSGTISEESAIAKFPSVTLRDSMERPEALESGSAIMSRADSLDLAHAVGFAMSRPRIHSTPADYEIIDFSHRVVSVIISTAKLASTWMSLKVVDSQRPGS